MLQQAADDPTRFEGVTTLGVDEHMWHHVSTKPVEDGGRGPKELTGMVDLTRHRDRHGNLVVRARLLDLVPGRSGTVYTDWLKERGDAFRAGVKIAMLDPFRGTRTRSMTSSKTPCLSSMLFMPTSWLCRCRRERCWWGC